MTALTGCGCSETFTPAMAIGEYATIPDEPFSLMLAVESKLLRSEVLSTTVTWYPSRPTVIYWRDLAAWIKQGLNGVWFLDTKDEDSFLLAYPEFERSQYA